MKARVVLNRETPIARWVAYMPGGAGIVYAHTWEGAMDAAGRLMGRVGRG